MKIRAVIVDDDAYAIDSLERLLSQVPTVDVLASLTNPVEAVEVIRKEKPDLVFLDISMPEMSGFDLLDEISTESLEVIFVTGFNQYAITALRYSALDYLLKPVQLAELSASVERYHQRSERILTQSRLLSLKKNLSANEEEFELVLLTKSEGEKKFKATEIVRCEADSNYSTIYLNSGRRFTASKTLGDLEDLLSSQTFVRIHKSHLVNKRFVSAVVRGSELLLSDETSLPISRRRLEEVRSILGM